MVIVLQATDSLDDIIFKGCPIEDVPHTVIVDSSGRTVVQLGDSNEPLTPHNEHS